MISQIISDLNEIPITLVSRRGWGKSSSVKTVVKRLLDANPEIIVKIFDPSLNWYHSAPVKFRQYVTQETILAGEVDNIGSCVYGLNLKKEDTRSFIASVIRQDYNERLTVSLRYGDLVVKTLPMILYVFEEANILFNTNSLRRDDESAEVFNKYISISRNLGFSGIFITTKAKELSPAVRDRSKILWGRVLGESDLRLIKSVSSKALMESSKILQKYFWLYDQNPVSFRIRDECKTSPIDYKPITKPKPKPQPKQAPQNEELDINGNVIPKWKKLIAEIVLGLTGIAGVWFVVLCIRGFSFLII